MSAPKEESRKPLRDRTIKDLAADAAGRGMRLQIGAEPIFPAHGIGAEPVNDYAMTSANPTAAEIREVIAHLKTLADTFPGIIHAANGPGLSGSPMNTMGALDRACEMLRRHANDVQDRETEREKQRSESKFHDMMATLERTRGDGITIGIAQKQARAKEARKGRRGAKKS